MAEVSFSGKCNAKSTKTRSIKRPNTLTPDQSWYKKYCHSCPYFIHEEGLDQKDGERVAVRCVRPTGEECIVTDSLLVSMVLMNDMLAKTKRITDEKKEPLLSIGNNVSTKKRRVKIHKRRR